MLFNSSTFSLTAVLLVLWQHAKIDYWGFKIHHRIKSKFAPILALFGPTKEQVRLQEELHWIGDLISKLRSGISLQNILEDQVNNKIFSETKRELCKTILYDKNRNHLSGKPIAQLLQQSIREGFSCVRPLLEHRNSLENELKNLRKAYSSSAQNRTQAYTICILPWILTLLLALSDPESFFDQWNNIFCQALWALAVTLEIGGIFWIKKIMQKTIHPNHVAQEKQMIQFLLQLQAYISSGVDLQTAIQEMREDDETSPMSEIILQALQDKSTQLPEGNHIGWQQLYSLLFRSIQFGSPIKEDLDSILRDIQNIKSTKEEEALQKLPLKLLAPLFCCIFLSAVVLLISTLVPYAEKISS